MNIYIIEVDTEVGGEEPLEALVHGPYPSHQRANATMQQLFDQMVENWEPDEQDDSDASHFYMISGGDQRKDWFIRTTI